MSKSRIIIILGALIALFGVVHVVPEGSRTLDERVEHLERAVISLQNELASLENTVSAAMDENSAGQLQKSAKWKDVSRWRTKLRKGMSKSQVRTLLGEPDKVDASPYLDTWYWGYPAGGYVHFDEDGVYGWSEP